MYVVHSVSERTNGGELGIAWVGAPPVVDVEAAGGGADAVVIDEVLPHAVARAHAATDRIEPRRGTPYHLHVTPRVDRTRTAEHITRQGDSTARL